MNVFVGCRVASSVAPGTPSRLVLAIRLAGLFALRGLGLGLVLARPRALPAAAGSPRAPALLGPCLLRLRLLVRRRVSNCLNLTAGRTGSPVAMGVSLLPWGAAGCRPSRLTCSSSSFFERKRPPGPRWRRTACWCRDWCR